MQTGRLDALQILRGIAAFMVVCDHSLIVVAAYDPFMATFQDFGGTIGRMGVNIFFVISGFIMVHSTRSTQYLSPFKRQRDFAWKRVTRLAPLYWIATFVEIGLSAAQGVTFNLPQIVTSLSFLPDFSDTGDWRMPPIVGVGWTLNCEALFYCIFGLTLLLPRRIGLLACMLAIVALTAWGALGLKYVHGESFERIAVFYTFKNNLFFAIGMAVALGRRFVPSLSGASALGVAIGMMAAALGIFAFDHLADGSVVWQSISVVTCAMAVLLAVSGRHMKQSLGHRLLVHVGDASFSTYLFHAMVLGWLAAAAAPLLSRGMILPFLLVAPVLCLAAGSLIHLAVERPITRYLRQCRRHASASSRPTDTVCATAPAL